MFVVVKRSKRGQEVHRRSSGAWSSVKGDKEEVVLCILVSAIGVQGGKMQEESGKNSAEGQRSMEFSEG